MTEMVFFGGGLGAFHPLSSVSCVDVFPGDCIVFCFLVVFHHSSVVPGNL